jgi:CheY-like chemotaxis protein
MNGFEVLEHYNELELDLVKDILIVFLTTSIRNRDRSKAFDNDFVYDFVAKPLTEEVYLKIARFYAENYRS